MPAPQGSKSLDEWLSWLETLHPKKIDLSLNRIATVVEALEIESPPYRVVTVAGTNGKGSCVAYLENIYAEAGYRVGSFTSPHLWCFNERICVDRVWATDQELIELFTAMEAARGKVTLSYFESSAVAAFLHFARRQVDVAVLEVGMGGRLDAVNVYDADAALITSIGLDHQEWLGDSRELIGREKAGIMRPGRPVIVADPDPPASIGIEAAELGAVAAYITRDFGFEKTVQGFRYCDAQGRAIELPRPRFGGDEQYLNAAACVSLVGALDSQLPVDEAALTAGIRLAQPKGRLESRELDGVQWIFDVAHNPAAVARFAEYVAGLPRATHTLAVFGAMRDKDTAGVLALCVPFVDSWYFATVESSRAATAELLRDQLAAVGVPRIECHEAVSSATVAARAAAHPGDRVLVFGSFYTVGPAMAALGLYSRPVESA